MWPWFGWNPSGYGMPYGYPYGGYGYGYSPWGAMPKEEEIRMLEDQEKWLTSELDGVEEEAGGASQIKKRDWCIISKLGKEVNYARI